MAQYCSSSAGAVAMVTVCRRRPKGFCFDPRNRLRGARAAGKLHKIVIFFFKKYCQHRLRKLLRQPGVQLEIAVITGPGWPAPNGGLYPSPPNGGLYPYRPI